MQYYTSRFGWMGTVMVLVFGAASQARADSIRTLEASGTLVDGATLSGTVAIDVTTGMVTSVALAVSAPDSLSFPLLTSQEYNPAHGTYEVGTTTQSLPNTYPILYLDIPETTLVGYNGGPLNSEQLPSSIGSYMSGIATAPPRPLHISGAGQPIARPRALQRRSSVDRSRRRLPRLRLVPPPPGAAASGRRLAIPADPQTV
jgi:hypothetical protein